MAFDPDAFLAMDIPGKKSTVVMSANDAESGPGGGDIDLGAGRSQRAAANNWSPGEQLKHDVQPDANPTPKEAARGFLGMAGGMAAGSLAEPLAKSALTGAVARSAAREPGALGAAVKDIGHAATSHAPTDIALDLAAHTVGVPHGVVTALRTAPAVGRAAKLAGDEGLAAIGRGFGMQPFSAVARDAAAAPAVAAAEDTHGIPNFAFEDPDASKMLAPGELPRRLAEAPGETPTSEVNTAKVKVPAEAPAKEVSPKMAAYKARLADAEEAGYAKRMNMSLEDYRAMVARAAKNPNIVRAPDDPGLTSILKTAKSEKWPVAKLAKAIADFKAAP